MHNISENIAALRFSVIRKMGMRAQDYDDVITLGIGEPDMHTPLPVCQAAYDATCKGQTHYAPSQGDTELREALVAHLNSKGLNASLDQVFVTHGAMHALACAMRTLLEPGDEVLIPSPHFPDYAAHVTFAHGKVVDVPTRFEDGFLPSVAAIEERITPRSKVLIINSPSNPTGATISGKLLDDLAELAIRRNLVVISDEVYDRIQFQGVHESIVTRPGMAERTLVVNSFSKSFAMTGWRVGYAFGPLWLMEHMLKVISFSMASVNTPGQRAALAALTGDQSPYEEMAQEFARRSSYVYERLADMPGIKVNKPSGSFYIFPSIAGVPGQDADGERFALELLDKAQVVVIPGFTFGAGGDSCVRLACTVEMKRLETAMDRMERFIRALS